MSNGRSCAETCSNPIKNKYLSIPVSLISFKFPMVDSLFSTIFFNFSACCLYLFAHALYFLNSFWFAFEIEFVTTINSFYAKKSNETVELLEDTQFIRIESKKIREFAKNRHFS